MTLARWIAVLGLAVVIVVVGAIWSIRSYSRDDAGCISVLVSKVDIPARTQLDPLIAAGNFPPRCVGNGFIVQGAVTDVRELQGQRTYAQIYANEQIPLSRLLTGVS